MASSGRALTSVPPGLDVPIIIGSARLPALDPAPAWRHFDPVIRRYLATRLFGNWWPYLGLDLQGVVAALATHAAVLRHQIARRLVDAGTADEAVLSAIRDTDLLMVHLSDRPSWPAFSPSDDEDVRSRTIPEYVTIDTRSDERSRTVPTTPGQLVLLRLLVDELRALGLADASMDEHGYVMATVPATTPAGTCRPIGFIAHVDTSPEMPGDDVKPIVHERYDGRDLVLPDDPDRRCCGAADNPALAEQIGDDIVTASGTTLLGADDKAGVAEIVAAAEYLVAAPGDPARPDPRRVHAGRRDRARRGCTSTSRGSAPCAPTRWTAAAAASSRSRASPPTRSPSHSRASTRIPGYAKGRMVNAIKVAADFIARLPQRRAVAGDDRRLRGVSCIRSRCSAGVDRTSGPAAGPRLRDGGAQGEGSAASSGSRERWRARIRGASVEIAVEESYRNMREVLDTASATSSTTRARRSAAPGSSRVERPIRGGTDGSRLSFMGLPTPNLFAGEHNFHSRLEWVSRAGHGEGGRSDRRPGAALGRDTREVGQRSIQRGEAEDRENSSAKKNRSDIPS